MGAPCWTGNERGTGQRVASCRTPFKSTRSSRDTAAYMTADSAGLWPVEGVPRSLVVQEPFAVGQIVTALSTLMTDADTGAVGHA